MRPAIAALRPVAVLCASLLGFAGLTAMSSFHPPSRLPQIPVAGSALQSRFDSYGEHIDVQTDQLDFQRWPQWAIGSCAVPDAPTVIAQIELSGNENHNSYGVYLTADPIPTLYPIFPAEASDGWFAVALFRSSPDRLLVHLFDDAAVLVGTTTYLGVAKGTTAFYAQTASGTLYGEDARNPGGEARSLAFASTRGTNADGLWICWETQPLPSSAYDFSDGVLYLARDCDVPVSRTSWGRLKARFR